MSKTRRITRRGFVGTAAASLSVPWLVPGSALGADGGTAANERFTMGAIGMGGQGTGDMGGLMGHSELQVLAVCDPVPAHRERAKKNVDGRYQNSDCKAYNDFREVIARDDIDSVLIGTPDHWHAIIACEAMKAGKDVFCEKPETLTIREGRVMV
ncbi:MAG: Gfo/Idh/MocA family oxidoreductase, partial [Candidatus Nealsonbacteria bacterium]|nr:Gfo/Idh/MocA family oxidoreductase [Candidatus Nealsonbacteria bacterium]